MGVMYVSMAFNSYAYICMSMPYQTLEVQDRYDTTSVGSLGDK